MTAALWVMTLAMLSLIVSSVNLIRSSRLLRMTQRQLAEAQAMAEESRRQLASASTLLMEMKKEAEDGAGN